MVGALRLNPASDSVAARVPAALTAAASVAVSVAPCANTGCAEPGRDADATSRKPTAQSVSKPYRVNERVMNRVSLVALIRLVLVHVDFSRTANLHWRRNAMGQG